MASRADISFPSENGQCRGWLYLPDSATPRPPVVVMAHGLGGVKEMRLDTYAERFQAAGYACLVFDYRHFGASDGEPRQLLDIGRQLQDWASAIHHARNLGQVDGERIALWGTSFGGGHALAAGARDGRVAAVIAQCPFTDGMASIRVMEFPIALRLTLLALWDTLGAWFGSAPVLVPISAAPGELGMMTTPDAKPGYLALVPEGLAFRHELAARIALHIPFYRPGRLAEKLGCPALFCVCDHDSVAPAEATLRHAARVPRGEVRRYPEGHFDIYVGDAFERVVADQLDFLARHLPVSASATP